MRYIFSILLLALTCLFSCGQNNPSLSGGTDKGNSPIQAAHETQEALPTQTKKYIHSQYEYADASGKTVTIQNSLNKGGPLFGSLGAHYNHSFLVFFIRIINERDEPLELSLEFPSDPFSIPGSPETFMKIFLPPDSMKLDKRPLFNYGLTGLESFLDFEEATSIQRTILPGEDLLFYTGTVFYQTSDSIEYLGRGGNRVELILKGEDLFLDMPPQIDSLPCGHLVPKI